MAPDIHTAAQCTPTAISDSAQHARSLLFVAKTRMESNATAADHGAVYWTERSQGAQRTKRSNALKAA